ncbi:MAG TPA: ClpXP protease specificity-enhancing factor, partial [Thiolapillus brandeum]|nr:ClpXP protease specificity-enhancing factor [Thiolapillus brandeum]
PEEEHPSPEGDDEPEPPRPSGGKPTLKVVK